jgi:hypothetical protein
MNDCCGSPFFPVETRLEKMGRKNETGEGQVIPIKINVSVCLGVIDCKAPLAMVRVTRIVPSDLVQISTIVLLLA